MLDQLRLVTNVKTHGRASHRRTVWLDDEPWRVMAVEALRECGIAVGDHVDVTELDERLRDMELQADVEHEIWSSWMRYMFTCGTINDDGTWTMPKGKVERWQRQMKTPYSELTEREKDSDREQVRKHWVASTEGGAQ